MLACLVPAVARQLEAERGREAEADEELSPSLSDQANVEYTGNSECYALNWFRKMLLSFLSII